MSNEADSPNVAVVRSIYQAFARGDVDAVLGRLDPAVRWTEADGFPYAGTYVGPQAVLDGVFARLGTDWEGFRAVPEELIDGSDTVVAVGEYGGTFRETGRAFAAPFAHIWRLEDGRVVRFRQFTDTALVREALP